MQDEKDEKGEKGEKATIHITLDEDGIVDNAVDAFGNVLEYEEKSAHRIEGSQLRLSTSNCCWKKVGGRWKCRSKFCR